ncbi:MAG: hypothetical protein ACRCXA_00070 [Peptostreptococcaceae bacterium]
MKKGTLIKLDRNRYLKFNLNSIRVLEKEHNIAFDKLEEEFSMEAVQKILYVGLLKDDPTLTFEEVGELVDLENIQVVVDALGKAFGGLQ